MLRLVITTEEGQVHYLELHGGVNRLGRHPDNDLPLEHPSISGYHCELTLYTDHATVRDLASTNGTFVKENPVHDAPVRLCPGESLRLGQVNMVLENTPVQVAVPESAMHSVEHRTLREGEIPDCKNHLEEPAIWRCTQCDDVYCNHCVHHLRRVGGKFLTLCPHCSHPCHLLNSAKEQGKQAFFERLKKWLARTVRLKP